MVKVKKERLIFSFLLVSTLAAQAQVGVNTVTPKSTLHVLPSTTGSATAEGIIAPNLTRAQLIAKDAKYTDTERGAIVYVTDLSGTLSAKTSKVTQAGYYFFDGSVWQQFASSMPVVSPSPWQVQATTTQATSNTENIYQTGKVAIGTGNNKVSDYNLQVAGTVFVSGDSRVGSSSVVGNETVGGTLGVTGATTLTGKVGIGRAPASGDYALVIKGNLYHDNGDGFTTGRFKMGGSSTTFNTSAQLELADTDKGFLPNRVALTNATLKTPVVNAVDGMMVYNTSTVAAQGLTPGYYFWMSNQWNRTTPAQPWLVQGSTTQASSNSQAIYQAGRVAIGTGATAVSTYTLQVAGTAYISGNSRVENSTVAGNETVSGTLAVTGATTLGNALTVGGTTNTKATNITGTLNYKPAGTAPAANTYLRTDASGNASWQALPVVATTEPWQVQGGSTLATTNSQNIYQTGSVGIGSNAAVNAAYKFQVSGASNITGNSRVASSTVVGAQTIGTTLSVTTTSTLTGKVGIGRAPAQGEYILAMTGNSYQTGNGYVSGSIKMGGDETFNTSAQLELKDANKGFLPNRVALTGATDKTTIPGVVDGMIVYNTRTVNDMSPGVYFWKNNSWNRFVDEIPKTSIKMFYQTTPVIGGQATGSDQAKMVSIKFSPTGGVNAPTTITLPEDGSYAFNVKLYTQICKPASASPTSGATPTYNGKVVAYVGIWVKGVLQDVSEVIINTAPRANGDKNNNGTNLANVILGCTGKEGDVIDIRLGYLAASLPSTEAVVSQGAVSQTPKSDRTSLIYWKL